MSSRALDNLKAERMKKLIRRLTAAFGRDNSVKTPEQIIAALKSMDCNFQPKILRIRSLGHRLEEIANQAGEAEQDIVTAFNRGEDVHARVADLRLVFNRYQDCFSKLSAENFKLSLAANIFARRLGQLIDTP